jgi:hypothetical protein
MAGTGGTAGPTAGVRTGRTGGAAAQGAEPGAVAGGDPGGMAARSHNGRACSGHGSGCSCSGCWTTFPACRWAPVPARCGRLQAPRGAPAAIGERSGQAIVRHEALGHGRDQLAAERVEEADGPPRLTVEATSGRSALSSIVDRASTQSNQIELANLWQAAVEGARPCNRPEAGPGLACWFGVEAPAGIEPATPSLPWNHREPLCGTPFPQLAPDRKGFELSYPT